MARKICVLTTAHPPSDVRIFHKECKSIARAGYDVTLIASADEECIRDDIRLLRLPRWKNRLDRVLRGSFAIYKKARESNADIYHFHDPELIPTALLLRLARKKVVYDIHEDLPRTISYKPYIPGFLKGVISQAAEFVENWAGGRFSALVAATPTIGKRFRKVNDHVAVVNNYPRIEEIEPPAGLADEKSEGREAILLYVGMRITHARGAVEMVQAAGLLPDKLQARLRLVGAWDSAELPQSLSSLPGWSRTEFVGPLDRTGVANELRRATVGLVILHPEPNYLESQPIKLFEYMCAGIPVIVSDFPVCREIVRKAGCGILVNPLDIDEIARAMEYLLTHPAEAQEMGRRGFQAVHENYNWANEEKTLIQMYERLFSHDSAYQPSLADTRCAP
jgi:glycosyltransferase involved in cell wall biosynthesis